MELDGGRAAPNCGRSIIVSRRASFNKIRWRDRRGSTMEGKKTFRTARLLTAAGTIAGQLGFLTCSAGMAQNATTINANGAFGSVSTEFGFTFLSLDVTRGGTGANQTTLLFYFTQTPTSDCTATTTDRNGLIPNGDFVGGVGLRTDNRLTLNVDTSAVPGFSNETCIQDYC